MCKVEHQISDGSRHAQVGASTPVLLKARIRLSNAAVPHTLRLAAVSLIARPLLLCDIVKGAEGEM